MRRFVAVLLAAFISGPTCLCLAGSSLVQPASSGHECCQEAHGAPQNAPADVPCECHKCLVKRTLADAPVQPPAIAWTATAPLLSDWKQELSGIIAPTPALRFLTGSGPPHEPRADLVRHRALLL